MKTVLALFFLSAVCPNGSEGDQHVVMYCSNHYAQELTAAAKCTWKVQNKSHEVMECPSNVHHQLLDVQLTNMQIEFRLNLESHGRVPSTISVTTESRGVRNSLGAVSIDRVTALHSNGTSATIGSSQKCVDFVVLLCGIGEGWFTMEWEGGLNNIGWSVSGLSVKTYENGGWTPADHNLSRKKSDHTVAWEMTSVAHVSTKLQQRGHSSRLVKRQDPSVCICRLNAAVTCALSCPISITGICSFACELHFNATELSPCICNITISTTTMETVPITTDVMTTVKDTTTRNPTTRGNAMDASSTTIDITVDTTSTIMDMNTMDTTSTAMDITMDTMSTTTDITMDTTSITTMDTTSSTMDTTTSTIKDTMTIPMDTTMASTMAATQQINASTSAIQTLFESVRAGQDYNVMASIALLTSLSEAEYVQPIETDDLLSTFNSLFYDSIPRVSSFEERTMQVSQLLLDLNLFALRTIDEGLYVSGGISLNVSIVDSEAAQVNAISVRGNSIVLPNEVLRIPNTTNVTIAAFLFENFTQLLQGSFNGSNETSLVSPVISSALLCGETVCNTSFLQTEQPVRIEQTHQGLEVPSDQVVNCVFWEFTFNDSGAVIGGKWSNRGCALVSTNSTLSICECNHLTHFAILLSPRQQKISEVNAVALRVIGYVGVSVSLITLAITVLILTCVKSLWNLRNYIHIHLCLSLMAAQIVFVAGVDKTSNTRACSAVAVLLHYLYLVSFMWMLMEGVVLYVVLVKVFERKTKKYYLIFTLLSYGLPFLYLSCLTIPLGFRLHEEPDYGHETACWLRYTTHFIWSFIIPVIIIIMINSGIFVIVVVIVCRQRKRTELDNSSRPAKLRFWLKSSISLVTVMGLTWVVGILFFDSDLLPFAYIITVLVAFQGVAIFIIFILLSSKVQSAILEWLRIRVNRSLFLSSHFGDRINSWANKSRQHTYPEVEEIRNGAEIQLGVHIVNHSNEDTKGFFSETALKAEYTASVRV